MPTAASREMFRFRDFELDLTAYELRRQGSTVRLERRPMDLLILLVQRRRQLVTRSDIVDRLWGDDVFVDVDNGINTVVSKVRQALRDSAEASAFVETVPGKGYRFIAPVEVVPEQTVSAPVVTPRPPEATATKPRALATRVPRPWLGALLVVILAGLVAWIQRDAVPRASRVTLAVLPFENLGGEEREYLANGLVEDTTASLGQIDPGHLSVIGRTSSMAYKGTGKSLATIGRELGVDYLVESSIRAEGDLLRITSKLIRVADQVQVWSASYDREPTSMLGLQRELSTAIAEQIRLRLSAERLDALARRQTRDAEAYDLYLRGRNFANQLTPATNKRAVEYYEQAIARDPNYALAWAGIAFVFLASPINSDAPPLQVSPRAHEAAARALQAAPGLAEAQGAMGYVHFFLDWDWPASEAAFRRAIALDPGYSLAHRMLGHILSQTGRQAEARSVMRRALEVDPLYAMNHAMSSQVAFQARDYPAAVEHARQAIVVDPEFWIGYIQHGQVLEQLGQTDPALEAFTKAARFSGGNSKAISHRGYALAKAGRTKEAREVLGTLEALSRKRYVPPYAVALVHAGLGERGAALDWLDRAYEVRDVHLVFLTVDPKWDPYRADPRFKALLARCDFTRTASAEP